MRLILSIFFALAIFVPATVFAAPKPTTYALSIESPTLDESVGTYSLNIRVDPKLSPGDTITIDYETQDGTATAGSDYTAVSDTNVVINSSFNGPSSTNFYVTIYVTDDAIAGEGDEYYNFVITNAVANNGNIVELSPDPGEVTILDNDTASLPGLAIDNNVTVNEDAGPAIFTVSLSSVSATDVTFQYATADSTAIAGSDYTFTNGTGTITAGSTSTTISVPIIDDAMAGEGSETFDLVISNPSTNAVLGNSYAIGTINDDDSGLTLSINDASVAETDSNITANVRIIFSQALPNDINITYLTTDNTATAPSDYIAVPSTTVTVPAGSTDYNLSVTIVGDTVAESAAENFTIAITGATGGIVIADADSTVTIFDNDSASGCSSYVGLMTINEYQNNPNYKDASHPLASTSGKVPGNYVEIKYIDFLVKQFVTSQWSIAIYTTAGTQTLGWDDKDPACVDPRYEVFQFNNNVMGAQGYVVLTDQNGNEVDVLNIDTSPHYAQQCHDFIYDIDFPSSAQNKDIFRDPDGTGDWFDHGSGANSGGSRCVNRQGGGDGGLNFQEFDALDSDEPLPSNVYGASDVPLKTKIVNSPFEVTIIAIDTNTSALTSVDAEIKVTLADEQGFTLPGAPVFNVDFNNVTNVPLTFSSGFPKAVKKVKLQFLYCYDGTGQIADYTDCYVTVPDPNLQQAAESRNTFALRPDTFSVDITPNSYKVAGDDIDMGFTALDALSTPSDEYNETENTSFRVDVNVSDSSLTCDQPQIGLDPEVAFADGNNTDVYKFDNVGEVNLTIYEIAGAEFASVDSSDTPDSMRYITKAMVQFNIIPDRFEINASLSNFGDGFTYLYDINRYDDWAAMAAILDINISALSTLNAIMTNYTDTCYAKPTEVNLSMLSNPIDITPNGSLSQFLYYNEAEATEGNYTLPSGSIDELPIENLAATFDSAAPAGPGTASIRYHLNFDRNQTLVVNPFTMDLESVDIKDDDNVTGTATPAVAGDWTATMIYGRAHAPRYRVECKTANCTSESLFIYYEFYADDSTDDILDTRRNDLGATDDLRSKDGILWFQNTGHNAATDGTVNWTQQHNGLLVTQGSASQYNGSTAYTYSYSGSDGYPYKATIDVNSSRWLIYDKYDAATQLADFELEFNHEGEQMAPKNEGAFSQEHNASINTSRRIQW